MQADLAAIRERHRPIWRDVVITTADTTTPIEETCHFDAQPWPCDTAQVLAALDELRHSLRDTRVFHVPGASSSWTPGAV